MYERHPHTRGFAYCSAPLAKGCPRCAAWQGVGPTRKRRRHLHRRSTWGVGTVVGYLLQSQLGEGHVGGFVQHVGGGGRFVLEGREEVGYERG